MNGMPLFAHFIRRDFRSYRFYWAVLAGFTAVGALISLRAPDTWWVLSMAYLLFAMAPLNGIAGVTWRSQHIMSRNYLLALPVPRRRMFAVVQARALVFWVPLAVFALMLPWVWHPRGMHWTAERYLSLELTLAGLLVFGVNMTIAMQLHWERIAAYLDQRQRFRAWVTTLAICAIESQVAAVALILAISLRLGPILPVFAAGTLAAVRYFANERRWTGLNSRFF